MKIQKTAALAMLLAACFLCLLGCEKQAKADPQKERQIVASIIDTFDAKADDPGVEPLLAELETVNPRKAAAWQSICEVWIRAYRDDYVNMDKLPENLPEDDSLAIVVLGYALNADGSMKAELIGRLKTAYVCAQQYPNAYVILTGGGTASNNKSVTEADAMAGWMWEQGIAESRIIVENQSMTTLENAGNTLRILEADYPGIQKLAIVTSDYHVPWGVVNFHAVIQYDALAKGTEPVCEIVSNAGYRIDATGYTFQSINQYQKSQLHQLEDQYSQLQAYQ